MPGPTVRKAVECFFAEIAQLPDGTYYVSLTATTIDDEEPQLLNMEIDSRRGACSRQERNRKSRRDV